MSGRSWTALWTVPSRSFVVHALAFLPSLERVIIAEENLGRDSERPDIGKYSSILTIRDERTGELIAENDSLADLEGLQQFAVGGVEPVVALGSQGELHLYNPADHTPDRRAIETGWPHLRGMVFHPSGRFLLTVAEGPNVSIWDTESWKVVRELDWEIGNLRSVGVSRDGCLAAVGSDRGIVNVWDWEI
jgi:hypothetical protein